MFSKIKNYVGELFGFNQTIKKLTEESQSDKENIIKLENNIKAIIESEETKTEKLKILEELIEGQTKEREFEEMITNKIPKALNSYMRKEIDRVYYIDVRNFFMINDESIPIVSGKTNDEKALAGLKKLRSIVTYVSDTSSYGVSEYWAFPYQTLTRKIGDCEDGAILLANILVKSGVPYYRVRICAGSVNGGGHAYCVYCRETDNEWVVLDWCYWPNDLPVHQRKTHKQERNYFDSERNFYVWFSWDLKNIYAKETLSTEAAKIFKEQKKNIFELFKGW